MNLTALQAFLSGAISLGFFAIGMFFFGFWRHTHDRLFALFATAFCLLGVERIVLILVSPGHEFRPYIYFIRLLAFTLIIFAIADRNRASNQ